MHIIMRPNFIRGPNLALGPRVGPGPVGTRAEPGPGGTWARINRYFKSIKMCFPLLSLFVWVGCRSIRHYRWFVVLLFCQLGENL